MILRVRLLALALSVAASAEASGLRFDCQTAAASWLQRLGWKLCQSVAVAPLYQSLPEGKRTGRIEWPGKEGVTSSDALTCVRRWLWREWGFPQAGGAAAVEELPPSLRDVLFYALAPAA